MKILQVLDGFVPAKFGGTKAAVYNLSKALIKKEHEVFVYTTDADVDGRLTDIHGVKNVDGMKVHYFRNISNQLAYKYRLFFPPGIGFTAKKEIGNYDIIHLHCARSFQNIVVHHYARKYGVPYVLDQHGSLPRLAAGETGYKWPLRRLFDVIFGNRIIRNATKVVAQNDLAIREYKKFGVADERIALIPLFFPIEDFLDLPAPGEFRKRYGIVDKRVIMSVGRINRIKGLDFLIESFHELSRSRQDIILTIVGPDDGYQGELEHLVSKLNLGERVLFTGFLGGKDKLAALLDADVVIQPSRYEQAALAPIEAVMCGTPIIVSKDTGAGEDVKRLDAGDLVKYGDKKGMVETIGRILDDPSEARAKTQKARDFIRANLSMTQMIKDYEKIYLECIEENKQLRRNR